MTAHKRLPTERIAAYREMTHVYVEELLGHIDALEAELKDATYWRVRHSDESARSAEQSQKNWAEAKELRAKLVEAEAEIAAISDGRKLDALEAAIDRDGAAARVLLAEARVEAAERALAAAEVARALEYEGKKHAALCFEAAADRVQELERQCATYEKITGVRVR